MTDPIPARRIQLLTAAPKPTAAMLRLERTVEFDPRLSELVKVRASQINGCAVCIDMHWKDARANGESEERLYALDAWRESPLYDERERAALELCEAMTLIADGHVPDVAWERASTAFDEAELAQLVFAITAINAWNRLMITARVEPGHYQPALKSSVVAKLEAA
jgi:AhpD family alkylhydroperoxidase